MKLFKYRLKKIAPVFISTQKLFLYSLIIFIPLIPHFLIDIPFLDRREHLQLYGSSSILASIAYLYIFLFISIQLASARFYYQIAPTFAYVFSVLCAISSGLITMSRGVMILMLIISTFIFLRSKKFSMLAVFYTALAIVLTFGVYIGIDLVRSSLPLEATSENFNRVSYLFTGYFLGPTFATLHMVSTNLVNDYNYLTNGAWFFGGLIRIVNDGFLTGSESLSLYNRFSTDIGCLSINSYSYAYYLLSDFGILGANLLLFILGFATGKLIIKNRSQSSLFTKTAIGLLYLQVLISPRDLILIWKWPWLLLLLSILTPLVRNNLLKYKAR